MFPVESTIVLVLVLVRKVSVVQDGLCLDTEPEGRLWAHLLSSWLLGCGLFTAPLLGRCRFLLIFLIVVLDLLHCILKVGKMRVRVARAERMR